MREICWKTLASAVVALAVLGGPSSAAAQDEQQVADGIRDRFFDAVRACGVEPRVETPIVIETSPIVEASYRYADRAVHLSRWDGLSPEMRGMLAAWAEHGAMGLDAEGMYREIFGSFVVPHELGHAISDDAGRMRDMPKWDSELEANRIAVAFWALQEGPAGDIDTRVRNSAAFYERMPSPVPEGDDPRAFFERHYDDFINDRPGPLNPMTYGWFISRLLVQAAEEREAYPFCDLIQLNRPQASAET